jgi:hypothetical protein
MVALLNSLAFHSFFFHTFSARQKSKCHTGMYRQADKACEEVRARLCSIRSYCLLSVTLEAMAQMRPRTANDFICYAPFRSRKSTVQVVN